MAWKIYDLWSKDFFSKIIQMKLEKLSFEVFEQSLKSDFETVFWENHHSNHQLCTAKEMAY